PRHGEGHAEDGVGAEPPLVVGAVELDELLVDRPLLRAVEPDERVANLAVHVVDGTGHALATEALVAVAQLDRLVLAGRGPRRDHGAALGARHEMDLHLHRRVAAGVEDLAAHDVLDARHVLLLLLLLLWVTLPPTPGGRVGVRVRPLTRRRRAPGARDLVNGLSGRSRWAGTGSAFPVAEPVAQVLGGDAELGLG